MLINDERLPPRFWQKVLPTAGGCWEWNAGRDKDGYGTYWARRGKVRAYRRAYETLAAAVPAGMQLDHVCRNRTCVNPSHLEPVTCRENLLRGDTAAARNASKTHCHAGHEFTPENTGIDGAHRYCRECKNARRRRE